jgi:hypothetical protein
VIWLQRLYRHLRGGLRIDGTYSLVALDLYSGCTRFEIRPGHQVNWVRFIVFSQSLQESTGIVPQLGHNRFFPNPFQYIWHCRQTLAAAKIENGECRSRWLIPIPGSESGTARISVRIVDRGVQRSFASLGATVTSPLCSVLQAETSGRCSSP